MRSTHAATAAACAGAEGVASHGPVANASGRAACASRIRARSRSSSNRSRNTSARSSVHSASSHQVPSRSWRTTWSWKASDASGSALGRGGGPPIGSSRRPRGYPKRPNQPPPTTPAADSVPEPGGNPVLWPGGSRHVGGSAMAGSRSIAANGSPHDSSTTSGAPATTAREQPAHSPSRTVAVPSPRTSRGARQVASGTPSGSRIRVAAGGTTEDTPSIIAGRGPARS